MKGDFHEKILIVDDDVYIGDMLEEMLIRERYGVWRAYSGTEALLLLEEKKPDLVLLDLMLPGLQGEELLPKIDGIPVIVISAKSEVSGKVKLLLQGASDYITKPFEMEELLARVAVQFRKNSSHSQDQSLCFQDLTLNLSSHELKVGENLVRLTKTEYAILKRLMQNPSQVLTKSQILDLISEDTPDCTENSLKVHISNLRRKLRQAGQKDYVESVWGIGFKLYEE